MNNRRRPDRRKAARRRTVLVSDWRQAYKWASVQIAALIASAQGLIIFVPTMKDYIPASMWHSIMFTSVSYTHQTLPTNREV